MNTVEYVSAVVYPAAMMLLPPAMNSIEAKAETLSIGFQESQFLHRRQIVGPARGFWQFEAAGGVRGVLNHPATAGLMKRVLATLRYEPEQCYAAIADNDVLACVFARLLLFTHPKPLPKRGDPTEGWRQYMAEWRPGKPHPELWAANYERGWQAAEMGAPA